MANAANTDSPLSGDVMFYKRPEPLSFEAHGKLGLNPTNKPFAFAAGAQAVPLIVAEFGPASLQYPIVFAGGGYQPLAVLGLRAGENLFVEPDGNYRPLSYIPAFIRRYPFVFAHGDEEPERLIVCIDRDADVVGENPQVPFFEGNEPSEFTRKCLDFCSNFETERRKTDEFVNLLRELDLFEIRTITFTPTNPDGSLAEPVKVSEHFSPSEARVKALPEATQIELMRTGALQQIHLHWNSLLNWERLVNEVALKNQATMGGAA